MRLFTNNAQVVICEFEQENSWQVQLIDTAGDFKHSFILLITFFQKAVIFVKLFTPLSVMAFLM